MKKKLKTYVLLFLCAILLVAVVPVQYRADENLDSVKNGEFRITLSDSNLLFIGNDKKVSTEVGKSKVCLIYTVEENTTEKQNDMHGVIATTDPTMQYPYTAGNALLRTAEKIDFFTEGYTYFFCFERTEQGFQCIAYKTNGKVAEKMSFYGGLGPNDADWTNYGIWVRNFDGRGVNAVLTNVRCYDGEGNNLGVVCNQESAKVEYFGELLDYSTVCGSYYCKENNQILVVDETQQIYLINENGEKQPTNDFHIYNKSNMWVSGDDGKEMFDYEKVLIEDADGNQYKYMRPTKVTFVNGEDIVVVEPSVETGYRVSEPEEPSMKGNEFKGWYLGDDTEYDFSQVVTESITLYAKWVDGDGNEYLAVDDLIPNQNDESNLAPAIAITVSVVILVAAAAACIMINRKKVGMK